MGAKPSSTPIYNQYQDKFNKSIRKISLKWPKIEKQINERLDFFKIFDNKTPNDMQDIFIILESNKAIPYTSNVFLHSRSNKSANYEKLFTWGTEMRKVFQNMHNNILNMSEKIQEIYQYIHADTYPLVKKCIEVLANYANECYQFAYENKNKFNIDIIKMWQQRETDFINKFYQMHNTILKFSPKQVQFLPNQPLVPVTEYIPPAITIVNPQTLSNSIKNTERSPIAQNPVAGPTLSAPIFVAPQEKNFVSKRVEQTNQILKPYVVDQNYAFTRQEVPRQIPVSTEGSMDKHVANQHLKIIQPEMKYITQDIQASQQIHAAPQAYPDKSTAIQDNTTISVQSNQIKKISSQNEYIPYPIVHSPELNPQSFNTTPNPLNYTSFSLPKPPPPPPMTAYYESDRVKQYQENISPAVIHNKNNFSGKSFFKNQKVSGGGVNIDYNNIKVKIQLQQAFYAMTQNQDIAKTQFHK